MMLPNTFPITIEEEVLANAFCTTDMMISPAVMNNSNGTLPMLLMRSPTASENTARNRRAVTTGANNV